MRGLWIVGIALSLAALGGCTRDEKAQVREGARDVGQQMETAAQNVRQQVDEAALEAKVKTALSTRKGLNAGGINVEAKGAVVTLKGDVNSRAQAELAEQV